MICYREVIKIILYFSLAFYVVFFFSPGTIKRTWKPLTGKNIRFQISEEHAHRRTLYALTPSLWNF